ncbi:MAG: iron ABC transporter ATP-binding protein [Spirochaetes bacterium DG_61]|jgi:iron(III) transport system ATP-binding protein|nr:MAG: iron ABC transporter ATP-binding protein [Spirochaetes bacterium DG_61]
MARVIVQEVTKKYGNTVAVSDFSIEIEDGEFFTLLGPSGCGKTTLLRCIAGFINVTKGKIFIGDRLVSSEDQKSFIPPEKRNLGMVFQSYAVWPHMNVFGNVAYPLKIKRLPEKEIKSRVRSTLELLKLGEFEKRYPNELSGGQQQRVALGRALIMNPDVLLLDEPLSNLDAKLREEMRFELKELQKRIGVTIVYVTHDQSEAMVMSKRIVVMNEGRVHQIGTPNEIYKNPHDEFVASFIGKSNFIDGELVGKHNNIFAIKIEGGYVINVQMLEDIQKKDLTVMIRHHNVEISRIKLENSIPATIKLTTYLGDQFIYEISLGKTTLIAQVHEEQFFKEGEDVYIKLNNPIVF